jgi:hypothetical protein
MSTRSGEIILVENKARPPRNADNFTLMRADCLDNVGSLAPHKPMGLEFLLFYVLLPSVGVMRYVAAPVVTATRILGRSMTIPSRRFAQQHRLMVTLWTRNLESARFEFGPVYLLSLLSLHSFTQ